MTDENGKTKSEQRDEERKKQTWYRYIVIALAVVAFLVYIVNVFGNEDLKGSIMGQNMLNSPPAFGSETDDTQGGEPALIDENGSYTSKDDVALYIHTYGRLPQNFITKNEAKKLGWVASKGNLDEVAPGKSIGGDRFSNYQKILPEADGRTWTECDINFDGGYRGAERIAFSNDGLIYYSYDHYESFEQLYGEEAEAA